VNGGICAALYCGFASEARRPFQHGRPSGLEAGQIVAYNRGMRRLPRSALFLSAEYLLAVLLVGLVTGVLHLLRDLLNVEVTIVLYLLPVVISTLLWGLGPGVLAALAAFFAFNYFFIEPRFTLLVQRPQDLLVLAVFLATAVVLSQLLGRTRTALSAAQQREHEALRLYEFSTALAGQQTDQSIARTIAQYTVEVFQADRVEVLVEGLGDKPSSSVTLPADRSTAPDRPPTLIAPLLTARGLQGEIRVWLERTALTPAEDRLLKTFATQGALAVERSQLARSDTRARVAEESDQLKTALLSSVSHELRTPLAAIKAAVTSLRGGMVDRHSIARDELLATIEEETDQLNVLVGNLLDMSRIEAGVLKPQRAWNDLEEIISAALARLKQTARQHHLELAVPDDLPLVPVDFVQIQQVFINLIGNGLKYAPAGTIIRVEAQRRDRAAVVARVINHGPLVPDEQLDRIFDKFYRATAADRVTGTGLGLSICKGIIEAHGGRIWAENLVDGLAFNFTLPLVVKDMPPLRRIARDA
jgi:two-component system, OmpR family, sensor histidine kinase KdpD